MKLLEKKCPNCGAQMSFKKDDKEVTCGYCRKSFIIENDNPEGVFDVESYKLINNTMGIMSGMHFVIFGIALFMIVGISVAMFNNIKNNKINDKPQPIINNGGTKNNNEKDSNYLTKYSEIGQDLIDLVREGEINALDNTINFYVEHFMPKIVNSWEYVGSYFLVRNETSSRMQHNILYDIYSITYKIDGENKTYYGVVVNSDFMRSGDKIVTLGNTLPAVPRNDLKDGKIAFGYINLDAVFNELVGKNIDFTIETNTFEG